MKKTKILVKTVSKNYSIFIGNKIIKDISKIFKSEKIKFNKCLIVADTKIPNNKIINLRKKIPCREKIVHNFISNEKNKNQKSVEKILNILLKNNFNRNDCLISLGGGICGDVSGFVSSIYKRGIKFINLPSTLLAQVDSSIGGKTGINNTFGKNLIGSFYQPDLVITDIDLLKSLPKKEIMCGYGEILKHSLIHSNKKFDFLNKNKNKILNLKNSFIQKAIIDSCKIKKNIVELDEKEKNLRKTLNLGHTFAHAYEATLKYSKKLNHGEAVILGIESAAKFSYVNKMLSKNNYIKIKNHILNLNLPFNLKKIFNKNKINLILNFMSIDKKNKSSKINLILLKDIGKPIINFYFERKKIESFFRKELFN